MAYGLYHGLIFFPVILSLIGPTPFALTTLPADEKATCPEELEPQLAPAGKANAADQTTDDESTELETKKINSVSSLITFYFSSLLICFHYCLGCLKSECLGEHFS